MAFAGIATAEKPTIVQVGNLKLTLNGGFSPKQLPKNTLAPIDLNFNGKIQTVDGSHPPALREVIVETDKNGAINAKGLPVCTAGQLNSRDTKAAEKACPNAIVGSGKTDVEIAFPEQAPIVAHSKLVAFNGGVKGGKTTIFIHAFLTVPVPAAVVTTVTVSKVHNGRYGTKSIAKVPVIAGGSGSPTFFELDINRKFTYKGKKQSYLLAKCPDGHLNAKATSIFSDGSKLTGSFVRSCTPKG
ncbi:MAG TPA: hypothetical protein VF245_08080 [Solirubrobacterales bacterium]